MQTAHGLAYVFISHDLAVVRALSDEIMVMKSGKVVERGNAEAIFEKPKQTYTQDLIAAAFLRGLEEVKASPVDTPSCRDDRGWRSWTAPTGSKFCRSALDERRFDPFDPQGFLNGRALQNPLGESPEIGKIVRGGRGIPRPQRISMSSSRSAAENRSPAAIPGRPAVARSRRTCGSAASPAAFLTLETASSSVTCSCG